LANTQSHIMRRSLAALLLVLACALSLTAPPAALAQSDVFAVLADTHVRFQGDDLLIKNNADTMRAFRWASGLKGLDGVIVAGDIADRGFAGDFQAYDLLWQRTKLTVPRIQCMGNHDTNNGGALSGLNVKKCTAEFKKINGGKTTSFQEFDNANVITLGGPYTRSGKNVYSNYQLKQLDKRLLQTARQGKMAVVVCHYPYNTALPKRNKMLAILESYPNVIFISGHVHYFLPSQWFQRVHPSTSATTPFKRSGINAKKASYSFVSIGADSVTRNHSVGGTWKSKGQTIGQWLRITNGGKVRYQRYDLKTGAKLKAWTATQLTGTVKVTAKSATAGKKGKMTYQVVFSDGKAHGGLESGATFKLKTGKSRAFKHIPAGVLVTVKCVDAPAGWSTPNRLRVEVTGETQTLVLKHVYKKPKIKKQSVVKDDSLKVQQDPHAQADAAEDVLETSAAEAETPMPAEAVPADEPELDPQPKASDASEPEAEGPTGTDGQLPGTEDGEGDATADATSPATSDDDAAKSTDGQAELPSSNEEAVPPDAPEEDAVESTVSAETP